MVCLISMLQHLSRQPDKVVQRKETYTNESSDDLYDSCPRCGVLNLWSWDTSVFKDAVGIKPDLEGKNVF